MKVVNVDFAKKNYYQEEHVKKQIVLHHTVSNPKSQVGDVEHWNSLSGRIATYAIIAYDGTIHKCFNPSFWAHHIGLTTRTLMNLGYEDYRTRNLKLNKQSIAIEIDAWGPLNKINGRCRNVYNRPIDKDLEVEEVDFRGYKYFQKYSKAQIETLSLLLPKLMGEFNIENKGIKDGNFDVRHDAISGESGIFSHTSYRNDKSDIYPDKDLINLLKKI